MTLRILDLFSGIGGISLGLERTGGFETAAFCEIDKEAQKVLQKHWPNVPIFEDVSTLSAKDIDGTIDVICGGFPCQDISTAGKGAGLAGERSGLWFQFHRLIKEIKPKWVIAENVSALRSRGLEEVLRSLSEIGYDAEWHCITASSVGAPHRRDRIWIVAYPSGSQRLTRTEEQGLLRALSEDGAVNNNSGGRGSSHTIELADSSSSGLEGQWLREVIPEPKVAMPSSGSCVVRRIDRSKQWATEPDVGRVANGVPRRSHRLKQLGNAVVPQIPEIIGNAILRTYG